MMKKLGLFLAAVLLLATGADAAVTPNSVVLPKRPIAASFNSSKAPT